MTSSEPPPTAQSAGISKCVIIVFLAVSAVGFVDAVYLTAKHYLGTPVTCSILQGCEKVTTSVYAAVGGVPVALLGSIYYLLVFLLMAAYYDTRRKPIVVFVSYFTAVGFAASLWFFYLQLFVIQALCLYCLVSAASSAALFALGVYTLLETKKPNRALPHKLVDIPRDQ